MIRMIFCAALATAAAAGMAQGEAIKQTKGDFEDKFRQLGVDLPTPNAYRSASGAPGPAYWQQRADYDIEVRLDEEAKRIEGSETITYHNNSPDTLSYLWVQLDQNRFENDSIARRTETASSGEDGDTISFGSLRREQAFEDFEGGYDIESVTGPGGDLDHQIVDTMMRIDLPEPLEPGQQIEIGIDWSYNIINNDVIGGRNGYEHFEDTDTYLYFMAQWFPRMAAYTDYVGWANKQFLGRGEFTLEFGDYDVAITVPSDHIVSSTGVLQNPRQVLTAEQRERLEKARDAEDPVFIVTPEEALENQEEGVDEGDTKTWRFSADNVRDFAWSSSRKYIWDAMGHEQDSELNPEVMAMSFYPNEAEPLWSKYSTHSVVHTMEVYSKFSFPYPYPTAQSVNTWESGGMEYPMITFNGYRPEIDEETGERTYSRRTKYGLIGVIIHEIGHIYFPMTVNSDERQWTWMDEGLNTFLQFQAERQWEEDFPARRGDPENITEYMVSEHQVPIMTQSDSALQFGNNAYAKPATALVVLRETVMGRELFDYAFKEYAERWKFKRPTPADFFRTMEDASAVDLDWFWRGWFYSTDHVDIAITDVRSYQISSQDPETEFELQRERAADEPGSLTQQNNVAEDIETYVDRNPQLEDFYNENDEFTVSNADRNKFRAFLDGLEDWERAVYEKALEDARYFYFVDFRNVGGLVMPLPLRITYVDGAEESLYIPAEIWRYDSGSVTKMLMREKRIESIELDPRLEIADTDRSNNYFPQRLGEVEPTRLELYKSDYESRNLMADMMVELKTGDGAGDEGGDAADEEETEAPLEPAGEPDSEQ